MTVSELMSSIRALPPSEQVRLFHLLEAMLYTEATPLASGDSSVDALFATLAVDPAVPSAALQPRIEVIREPANPIWHLLEVATSPVPVLSLQLKWLRRLGF